MAMKIGGQSTANTSARAISTASALALKLPSLDDLQKYGQVDLQTANSYGIVCQYLHKFNGGPSPIVFLQSKIAASLDTLRGKVGPSAPVHGISSFEERGAWLACLRDWSAVVLAKQGGADAVAKAQAPGILRFWRELSRLEDLRSFANSDKAQSLSLSDVQQRLPDLDGCEEAVLVICREANRSESGRQDGRYSPVVAVWLHKQANGALGPNEAAQLVINHSEFFDSESGEPRNNLDLDAINSWIALQEPLGVALKGDKASDVQERGDTVGESSEPAWADFIARWDRLTAHWIQGSQGLGGLCVALRGDDATAFTLRLVNAKEVMASQHAGLLESAAMSLGQHPLLSGALERIACAPACAPERLSLSAMAHHNFVGHMDTCKAGKRSRAFPLDPTQRMAAMVVSDLAFSTGAELLPVNGPPGTGKTSFLRAALASNWVRSALNEAAHPPVVYGVAATNQAVSNMIEAFGAIRSTEPDGPAYPWLGGLSSYGWFFPSKSEAQKRQDLMLLEWSDAQRTAFAPSGAASDFACKDVQEHQSILMERACHALGLDRQDATLDGVMACAHARLRGVYEELQARQRQYQKALTDGAFAWRSASGSMAKLRLFEARLQALVAHQRDIERRSAFAVAAVETLELLVLQESKLEASWRSLLPNRLRQWVWAREFTDLAVLRERAAVVLKPLSRPLHSDLPSLGLMLRQLESEVDDLSGQIAVGKAQIVSLEREVSGLREVRHLRRKAIENLFGLTGLNDALDGAAPHDSQGRRRLRRNLLLSFARGAHKGAKAHVDASESWIHCLEAPLDTALRVPMFHWAARYWECRWLQEELRQAASKDSQRIERLMMLGVIIVATTHKVIRLGKSRVADLLIMDEAGQCLPEIAAACLTLARNAVFVGDVLQLQPVANVCDQVQRAIARKVCPNEVLPPEAMPLGGSAMKIAQLAARRSSGDEPGVTLLFHYRCVPEIIGYCNALLYKGRIQNARVEPRMAQLGWMPAMSWVAVDGKPERSSGSWVNVAEVQAIVDWLVLERKRLTEIPAVGDQPAKTLALADVVAIVTPLARQAALLREALVSAFGEQEVAHMVIGTVHKLQGAERPVVLFSLVQSQPTNQRLMADRDGGMLMNVAVSRARDAFVVFADRKTLKPSAQDAIGDLRADQYEPISVLGRYLRHAGCRLYPTALVIVEAQGKVALVQSALGLGVAVVATHGTLRSASLHDDGLRWSDSPVQWLRKIQEHAGLVREVFIATDDDLAGELIGMHAADDVARVFAQAISGGLSVTVKRMRFADLTRESLNKAFAAAGENFDSQRLAAAVVREFANLIDARIYQESGLPMSSYASAQVRDSLAWLDDEWRRLGVHSLQEVSDKREVWCTVSVTHGAQSGQIRAFVAHDSGALAKPLVLDRVDAQRVAQSLLDSSQLHHVATRQVFQQPGLYPANTTARVLAMAVDELGLDVEVAQRHINALYLQGADLDGEEVACPV